MLTDSSRPPRNREIAGFLLSLAFTGLAAVRDVYFGGLFQRVNPLGVALLLIVLPNYVNQVGVALASPVTVRAVLAVGPVLVFGLQLLDGRLSSSPATLGACVLYGCFAVAAAVARRQAIGAPVGGPGDTVVLAPR